MTRAIQKRDTQADPWMDFERSFEELRSRFFDELGFPTLDPWPGPREAATERAFHPARVDVSDTGPAYKIVAEIPGIPKEKLDVRVRGAQVEIRGEQAVGSEKKTDGEFVRRERAYAGYYRWMELPEPVVGREVKAKVENGLLELELPKERPTPSHGEVRVPIP